MAVHFQERCHRSLIFPQDLICTEVKDFVPQALQQSLDFELNITNLSIIPRLYSSGACREVYIHGEPGSGCTTLAQGICQILMQEANVQELEILYITVNPDCSGSSLFTLLSSKAKERLDKETSLLLLQPFLPNEDKLEAASKFIEKHFKIICIDDADISRGFFSSLGTTVRDLPCFKIIVQNSGKELKSGETVQKILHIKLKGCKKDSAARILNDATGKLLSKEEVSNICKAENNIPGAMSLYGNFLSYFRKERKSAINVPAIPDKVAGKGLLENAAVMRVFKCIYPYARKREAVISTLYQLLYLRRPLPVKSMDQSVLDLLALSLLLANEEDGIHVVSVPRYVQKCLGLLCAEFYGLWPLLERAFCSFNAMDCWLTLLSEKLQQLIRDAEANAWPFIPEKWVPSVDTRKVRELFRIISANVHS